MSSTMDGMDMGDGGHTHSTGIGSAINRVFAQDYWYIIAGVIGLLTGIHAINTYGAYSRLKSCKKPTIKQPTKPDSRLSQFWATSTAFIRELKHPQYYVAINGLRWATPPSLGRILVLFSYWAVVIYFMSWNVTIMDVFYWERIGFRNAWVSLCQLPLLYLLAMKFNVVGYLIGSSHERLNWLHRWVARTMFVTATCHGFYFWTEWVRADFVEYELSILPLVRYGLGAWGILLWSVVVGFLPIRRLSYELWLVQHIISAVIMLWLLYMHIPIEAQYLLWMSISFMVFDRIARWINLLWQNIRVKSSGSSCQGRQHVGHRISARAMGDTTTVLTVKDVHFKWSPGQHIYLWVPRLGPIEAHPYTVACAHHIAGTCCCNSIQLILRTHKGFSKRINTFAAKNPDRILTGFLSGPFGAPPKWDSYETLVLIGASTGASFTVPILECVSRKTQAQTCVRRIDVIIAARTAEEVRYYIHRAKDAASVAGDHGIDVRLHVAITSNTSSGASVPLVQHRRQQTDASCCCAGDSEEEVIDDNEKVALATTTAERSVSSSSSVNGVTVFREYTCRPDIENLIREPVEAAWGETAVVVCGGREIVARTRNCVSRLSDERAVHKGTGAQGIYLHVEEYSF